VISRPPLRTSSNGVDLAAGDRAALVEYLTDLESPPPPPLLSGGLYKF
jgi:hypothetical protein